MNNWEEIYEKIIVYRDTLKNTEHFVEQVESLNKWTDWGRFGKKTVFVNTTVCNLNTNATTQDWSADALDFCDDIDNSFRQEYNDMFNVYMKTIEHYVKEKNMQLDTSSIEVPILAKYVSDTAVKNNTAMVHHIDYQASSWEQPGFKYNLTVLLYLNDDYEGGSVNFKIVQEDDSVHTVNYQPRKGDILIFPSVHPYYHGTMPVSGKPKYFMRGFWGYHFEGTQEWNEQFKLRGEDFLKEYKALVDVRDNVERISVLPSKFL